MNGTATRRVFVERCDGGVDGGGVMMILRSAAPSPFGRKVRIALAVLGLNDIKIESADTMDPRDTVRQQNVLGKIPVLISEDGAPITIRA